jgi:hypothetical protein
MTQQFCSVPNGVGNQDRCHKASVFIRGPSWVQSQAILGEGWFGNYSMGIGSHFQQTGEGERTAECPSCSWVCILHSWMFVLVLRIFPPQLKISPVATYLSSQLFVLFMSMYQTQLNICSLVEYLSSIAEYPSSSRVFSLHRWMSVL